MGCGFSPKHTYQWLNHTWEKHVEPRFKELCFSKIRKQGIPCEYLVVRVIKDNTWNPIFRFLRPASVDDIRTMIKALKGPQLASARTIVDKYISGWDNLSKTLSQYYGDNAVSGELMDRLGAVVRGFRDAITSPSWNSGDREFYLSAFEALCHAFGCLPNKAAKKHRKPPTTTAEKEKQWNDKNKIVKWIVKRRLDLEQDKSADKKSLNWCRLIEEARKACGEPGGELFGCLMDLGESSYRKSTRELYKESK